MEESWEKKGIEFDADLERVSYLGSEHIMHHVWDNLISNAIKFSPKGGLITLRLMRRDGRIHFMVEDQGPGIPEESLKRIFDKFYQTDSSHKQEGNGLGLSLAKRIVTTADGRIWAENLPQGGCRFTVIL